MVILQVLSIINCVYSSRSLDLRWSEDFLLNQNQQNEDGKGMAVLVIGFGSSSFVWLLKLGQGNGVFLLVAEIVRTDPFGATDKALPTDSARSVKTAALFGCDSIFDHEPAWTIMVYLDQTIWYMIIYHFGFVSIFEPSWYIFVPRQSSCRHPLTWSSGPP